MQTLGGVEGYPSVEDVSHWYGVVGRERGAAAEFRLVREPLMCRLYALGVPESMHPLRPSSGAARVGERWDRSRASRIASLELGRLAG